MNSKGFTFIELLITLIVISICFLPLLNMYTTSLSQANFTNDLTTARYLAQEGMERTKNLNYTSNQLIKEGDVWDPPLNKPPLNVNGQKWRTLRKIVPRTEPLEIHILVYKDYDRVESQKPVVDIVVLKADFDWVLVQ